MRIFATVAFVTAGAFVGLDYVSQKQAAGGDLQPTAYFGNRVRDAQVALGLIDKPRGSAVDAPDAAVSGMASRLAGADGAPVDLADPAAVGAAVAGGNTAAIGAAVNAEFAAAAAALDAEAPAAKPAARRPGRITIGSGACGERAGGKFCAVGD